MIFTDTNDTISEINKAEPFSTYVSAIKGNLTLGEFIYFEEIIVPRSERIYYGMIIGYEENKFKVQLLGLITDKIFQVNNFGKIHNEKASTF